PAGRSSAARGRVLPPGARRPRVARAGRGPAAPAGSATGSPETAPSSPPPTPEYGRSRVLRAIAVTGLRPLGPRIRPRSDRAHHASRPCLGRELGTRLRSHHANPLRRAVVRSPPPGKSLRRDPPVGRPPGRGARQRALLHRRSPRPHHRARRGAAA